MGKEEVEKMLEMINKLKEVKKENDALFHRLEEVHVLRFRLAFITQFFSS